ncbi:TfoX/Sxy family protein [Microbacterium sp. SLBN-146]|uniref:TfoX/Sxy family protein n=1 Tax=Microbacterium sp. SLBN-146 TaxID=2768457 RepID=UPI0011531613|nr:TfoX/Sxy family protein [Microbacterium sp. SLBN-146]TQJ32403.1 TfoX-like protein [Microbacterium sp. SLBN-146]
MPVNEAQSALADRVRALLSDEADLTEKAMFGSRAFLLDDRIAVAVFSAPALLVRVDAEDAASLALEPGASPAVMGPQRREMGPGWLLIDSDHLTSDEQLLFWVDAARDFQRRR